MTDQGTIWLTQEAYDKLQAELDDLKGPKRQEIIEKIAAARDEGDLKENSGYHAAKDDQGKQEDDHRRGALPLLTSPGATDHRPGGGPPAFRSHRMKVDHRPSACRGVSAARAVAEPHSSG